MGQATCIRLSTDGYSTGGYRILVVRVNYCINDQILSRYLTTLHLQDESHSAVYILRAIAKFVEETQPIQQQFFLNKSGSLLMRKHCSYGSDSTNLNP